MFERFRRARARRRENAEIVDALFERIADQARDPAFYTTFGVADTVMGRFEMLALHVHLFQHRAKDGSEVLQAMAQDVVDRLFSVIDDSLRQIGIGDVAVPKRMKRLARMVYGRWESYGVALDGNDRTALGEAYARNVYVEGGIASRAPALADYAFEAREALRAQPDDHFLEGRVTYPKPSAIEVA